MIHIKYDPNIDISYMDFGGDFFYNILEIVKMESSLKFNPKTKKWEGSALETSRVIPHLEKIEKVQIENEELFHKRVKKANTPETIFFRNSLKEDNLVFPPIEGKPPHEDFQLKVINKAIKQNRLALYLQMGLGKTYIIITAINQLHSQNKIDNFVVVSPPEGVYNWRREILRFSNWINENEILISSATNNRNPFKNPESLKGIKVIILTYRHFLTLSDDWYKIEKPNSRSKNYRVGFIPWGLFGSDGHRAIILDESHHIKNHTARQTKVIHLHKRYFDYRYIMTGTPTPNIFTEIYPQITFLDENVVNMPYQRWVNEIANVGNRFSAYAVNYVYKHAQDEWERKFSSLVERIQSKDVLQLPELYIKPIYAELSDKQKQIYQETINYMIFTIKEEHGRIEPRILRNKFPYISLAYENADLLKGKIDPVFSKNLSKLVDSFKFEKDHGKIEILNSLISEYIDNEKQKVTVFDFHPKTLDQLAEKYKKYNPIVIHGQTGDSNEERNEKLELFKKSKKHNLLIGSFRVLSTAINLTECKRVIYFSRDFSYVNWSQSIKRFHRIGQTESVIINPLIFENTLDEYIEKVIIRKGNLDKELFQSDSLSQKDWIDIFKGDINE